MARQGRLKDRIAGARQASDGAADRTTPAYYRRRVVNEIDLAEIDRLSQAERHARLDRIVGDLIRREGPLLSDEAHRRLVGQVIDELVGLGPIEQLLADDTVTEIMVNGAGDVWVERHERGLVRTDVRFTSEEQLMQTIERIVSQVNRRVDESSPMVDARLPSGDRVNVIIPPLSLVGPVLTIRRFPRLFTLDELVENGTMDEPTRWLLVAFVRAKLNIVISGGTGAGKTTLLNALSGAVPAEERIVTIEDNAELRLQQPHVVTLEARPPNVEGEGEVTIRDLVRNSLRMRPDRIIVGEVRGPETLDMLQALNTGHEGSLVTVHANSADDALHRLATLATMSDVNVPFEALRDQVNGAVEVVVQIERGADGNRRVVELAAVSSRRTEEFKLKTVAWFESEPIGPERVVAGRVVHAPLPPRIAQRLIHRGATAPEAFGERADLDDAPEREAE
jgi:pilus assembly protein CpaF